MGCPTCGRLAEPPHDVEADAADVLRAVESAPGITRGQLRAALARAWGIRPGDAPNHNRASAAIALTLARGDVTAVTRGNGFAIHHYPREAVTVACRQTAFDTWGA